MEIGPRSNSLTRPPIRGLAAVTGADALRPARDKIMTKPARKTTVKLNGSKKAKPPVAAIDSKRTTKTATVIALLNSRNGTTIAEMAVSTGWQNHSVRGFLSGTVKKKLGHEITSELVDRERRYRIAG